jgi:hypothetical protein
MSDPARKLHPKYDVRRTDGSSDAGFGVGWQPCQACGGSGVIEAYRVADPMGRCLQRIAGGGLDVPGDPPSLACRVLEGIAAHHGFARVVYPRDRTRVVELTEAGRLALSAWTALQEARRG